MELSVKRVTRFENEGAVKAFCDLAIDDRMVVKGLRVVSGRNGLFVSMPREPGKNGKWFDSVDVLDDELKTRINRLVLAAYEQADARP